MRRRIILSLLAMGMAVCLAVGACSTGGKVGHGPPPSSSATATHPEPPASVSATATAPSSSRSAPSASASPTATQTPAPTGARTLALGMHGLDVRQLQIRLAALHYYPGPADGSFGADTQEAVWAFQEAQGLAVTGAVGPRTRAALADPRSPAVLVPGGGAMRIEVHLGSHFLVLYVNNQVRLVSHVSTGGYYYYYYYLAWRRLRLRDHADR